MKKYFALLLALLLLCLAAPLALSSELYDTYGSMDDWDDATWELCESWTDEQWEDYWLGEEEAYISEREETLRAERQTLGLPNPDGVNVKLNDAFLNFANVWPYEEYGSVYLPLRGFLDACGLKAEITFNADTGVAHAVLADGRELIATLGSDEMTAISADGEEYPIYSYDPPLMKDGSFYVEQMDLCDFLGLDAQWDYYREILYLVDSEALIAQLNEEFSIYNRLFNISAAQLDAQQSYRLSGSITFNAALYGDNKDDTVQAVLEYNGLVRGNDADISFAVELDLDQIKDTLLSFMDDEDMLLLKAISTAQGRVIINSGEQAIYIQSNLLTLADRRVGGKDWLKMDFDLPADNMEEFTNMFMQEFMGISIGRLIYDNTYYSYYYYDSRDTYANALSQAKLWQGLIGDDNFKQEQRNGYTVYTLKIDRAELNEFMQESDIYWPGSSIFGSVFGTYGYYYDEEEPGGFSHNLTFREKDGQVTDLQMDAAAQTKGVLPVNYSLTLEYDEYNIKAHFGMDGRYGGKFSIDIAQQLTPVADIPAAAPPANSKIVTEQDLDSQRLYWF